VNATFSLVGMGGDVGGTDVIIWFMKHAPIVGRNARIKP